MRCNTFILCSTFGKLGWKKIPVLRKSWKQQAPIHFWRTWLNDHVTTYAPSEGSPPVLSRLQWKTTAAATVSPPQLYTTCLFSLLVCACLFVFLPPSLISLCQHIPPTHPPSLPFNLFLWMEILRGGGKNEALLLEYMSVGQIGSTCSSS